MTRALPGRVHLPSGTIARLSHRAACAAAEPRAAGTCLDHLAVLQAPGVLARDDGSPLDPLSLPLRDAHLLRALLAHAGVVPEPPASYTCENCDAPFDVAPSTLLEIAPFVDGELDDPELDAPFDFDAWYPIPAVRAGASAARRVRLAPRSVEEALPLWRAASAPVLRITPALVTAMGVVALGRERRASSIADALAGAPPRAWAAIVDLFHEAHYPPRLLAVYRCAACGARMDLDVPLERELPREDLGEDDRAPERTDDDASISAPPPAPGERTSRAARRAFPDLSAFEALVRRAADDVYRERRVRNIDLFIDADVPACDDGGEPLLGCYTPGTPPGLDVDIPRSPEIRIFYRTFRAEVRADPSFELEREIRETIDHEVTHHLHYLAGDDPLDDEERAEIDLERARIIGRREVARRAASGFAHDITSFLRTTWPVWVLLAAGSALTWCR